MAAEGVPVPSGFGTKLREARERRGISLRQIASATKISIGALEALEQNHVARLPGGIFSRAFVRSYAIEVGLDPEETIREFIAQFPHDSVTAGHPTSGPIEDNEALESQRRMASAFLRLVGFSLAIGGGMLYLATRGPDPASNPPSDLRNKPSVSLPAPVSEPAASAQLTSPPEATGIAAKLADPVAAARPAATLVATTGSLLVGLSATGPCWVSAVVDGKTAIRRELRAGERQMLEVRQDLVLTAGDAAALTLTINGEDARSLGKPGQVVTTRVNLSNFRDYLAAR